MSNPDDDGFSADEDNNKIGQDEEEAEANNLRDQADQEIVYDDSAEPKVEEEYDDDGREEHREDLDYDAEDSEEQEEEEDWKPLQTVGSCSRTVPFYVRYPWKGVTLPNDDSALKLAESLKKNESLKELRLNIWEDVTKHGAQAVSSAIESSAVDSLTLDYRYGEDIEGKEEPAMGLIKYIYPTSTMKNLQKLNIDYDLGNAEMEWIGIALRNNERLENLTLRLGDHRVEETGAQTFSEGIRSSTVSTLELQNATPEVCDILFATGILSSPQLRHFAIMNDWGIDRMDESTPQEFDLVVCEFWRQKSQLESLKLESCYLNIQNLQLIAWTMQENSSLKELRLKDNGIEDDSVQHLVQIMKGATQVEALALCRQGFTGCGLETLLTSVLSLPALKSLKLAIHSDSGSDKSSCQDWSYDGQQFPSELRNSCSAVVVRQFNRGLRLKEFELSYSYSCVAGIHQILKASTTWSFVTKLEIEQIQYNIGHKGLALIADALVTAKVSRFRLVAFDKDTSDEDVETKKKAQKEAFRGVVFAVKSNPYLQELDVNGTTDEMQFFLNLNKYGRQLLRLDHDVMPLGLWSHVLAKHGNEAGAVFYFLRELPLLMHPSMVKAPQNKRPCQMIQQSTTADETRKRRR